MRRSQILALLLALGLLLVAGCESSSDPAGEEVDNTAPEFVGADPSSDDSSVGVDAEITIIFSEAMDPDSATGNITLSSGTITDLTWTDDRTLVVAHSDWAEGVEVTVTVGTGLLDAAGNAMASASSISFYTFSSSFELVGHEPNLSAVDVNRSTNIRLLFSRAMNVASVGAATRITDDVLKADFSFIASEGEENWIILNPTGDLPAGADVTVVIDTSAQDEGGNNLPAEASFTFQTGADVDVTAPELLSINPPNGSTMPADQGFIKMTFSEPIDTESLNTTSMNMEFQLIVFSGSDPTWTENNTVLTVPLPDTMPAGTPMQVSFGSFADANGVVQNTPIEWAVTVAGAADYFPVVDDARFTYYREHEETPLKGLGVSYSVAFNTVELQPDGTFFWTVYNDEGYEIVDGWDVLERTNNALLWHGFTDIESDLSEFSISFDPPLVWAEFPLDVGDTWSVNSAGSDGETTYNVSWDGEVTEKADLPLYQPQPAKGAELIYWADVFKIEISFEVEVGGELFMQSTKTMWLSPTVGLVQSVDTDHELGSGSVNTTRQYLSVDLEGGPQ